MTQKIKDFITKTSESGLAILTLALIFFIPLYPKFPSLTIPQTYVRIRLEDFLVAFTYLLALPLLWQNRRQLINLPVVKAIITYWWVGLISLISGIFIYQLVWPHIALLHYLRRIEYMGLFFVGWLAVRNKKDTKVFLIATVIALLLVSLFGLGQKFFDLPVVSTMNEEFSKGMLLNLNVWTRISSTFGGHYDLGAYLAFILPLLLAIYFVGKRKLIWVILPIFALSYYLLILTASRISLAAYLGGVTLLLIFLNKKWWLVPVVGLSLLGSYFSTDINQRFRATIKYDLPRLTATVNRRLDDIFPEREKRRLAQQQVTATPAPTATTPTESEPGTEPTEVGSPTKKPTPTPTPTPMTTITPTATPTPTRQENTETGVARSGGIRFDVEWPRAIRHFKENPLIGTGYSSLGLATDNDYLRALGETGLLGLLAFANIFWQVGLFLLKQNQRELTEQQVVLLAGIGAATLSLLANAVFIDVFESSKVAFIYWLTLGIIMKTVIRDYEEQD